jgi:short-subunit dehydrogenase
VSGFSGKTAVITGASSGLGAALARELAVAGANLVLFARREEGLLVTADACEAVGAEVLVVPGDVAKPDDCAALIERTMEQFGAIDYLIANAGLSMWARFDEVTSPSLFRKLIETNYLGVVHCLMPALPHLLRSKGMVVAISSIQGEIGVPLHSGYVASKHAIQGLLKTLQMELEGTGVDILTVLPHWLRGTNLRDKALGPDGRPVGTGARRYSRESISLQVCSKAILQAVAVRRRKLVVPWKLRLLPWLELIHPKLAEFFVGRAMRDQHD